MPKASNSLQKRKRGGQPGNRNRLIHGRYSQEEAARREEIRRFRRKGKALVILVDNILKARKALKRRVAARALAARSEAARRPVRSRGKTLRRRPQRRNIARQSGRSALFRQSPRPPPHDPVLCDDRVKPMGRCVSQQR